MIALELKLKVKFIRRIYGESDSEFTIFAAEPLNNKSKVRTNKYKNITISGDFNIDDNDLRRPVEVTVVEDVKSKFPGSYKIVRLHYDFPKTAKEQWSYLESSNILPESVVFQLDDHYKRKDKIIDMIIKDPLSLTKLKGVGEKRALEYKSRLLEDQGRALIFNEIGDIEGVGPLLIKKIFNWKPNVEEALELIKEDPFVLVENEITGFITADKIRAKYGFPIDDTSRIIHGVKYYVTDSFNNTGNTYEDFVEGVEITSNKLGVGSKVIANQILKAHKDDVLEEKYGIKIVGPRITTVELFEAEKEIYKQLSAMKSDCDVIINQDVWNKNKKEYLKELRAELSSEQEEFLDAINDNRVTVLLGPGGSGKSWVTKIAVDLLKQAGATYGLFAPTARAAHVMQEYIGEEALTIHRGLLKYELAGEAAPYDVLIIDEFSMVDSELAHTVLKVLKNRGRLILIGDDFQLPSVGPGNVLFDIVNYIGVKTVKLTKIFRQAEGSGVLKYADDLRNGQFAISDGDLPSEDIKFYNISNSIEQKEKALELYRKAGATTPEDIMLLSPVNGGPSGRRTLNSLVQDIVNPGKEDSLSFGSADDNPIYYKDGDYITITRNEYNMENDYGEIAEIINGDLGYIIESNKRYIRLEIEKNTYTIPKSEVRDLVDHAWAITIHKSQGGQADEVIIVLPYNSYFMLNANMLYTAITRTKKRCHIIGDFSKINQAAQRQANFNRKTLIEVQSNAMNRKQQK